MQLAQHAQRACQRALGRHFAPGTSVTVSLTWQKPAAGGGRTATFHHTALVRPVVAPDGTLRLDIHRLFPGSLWLGTFTVDVTGPRGSKASTVFIVIPPGG